MSHDIQPYHAPVGGQLMAYPGEQFNASAAHAAGAHAKPQGLAKLHRLLRGRYKWAIALGLVLGAGMGLIGWFSQKPAFRSEGLLMIRSTTPTLNTTDSMMPEYQIFLRSQIAILNSRDMIEKALSKPDWVAIRGNTDEDAVNAFYNSLTIEEVPDSQLVKVSYVDLNAKAAQIGVGSLVDVYAEYTQHSDPLGLNKKLSLVDSLRTAKSNELFQREKDLNNLSEKYKTDSLEGIISAEQSRHIELSERLDDSNAQLIEMEHELGGASKTDDKPASASTPSMLSPMDMTTEQLASVDPLMSHLLNEKQSAQERLDETAVQNYGPNHPVVVALKQEAQMIDSRIADREAYLKANMHSIPQPSQGLTPSSPLSMLPNGRTVVSQESVDEQRALSEHLKSQVKNIESELEDMNTQREAINEVKTQIDNLKDAIATFNNQYDQLNNALFLNGQSGVVEVLSRGDLPMQPSVDRRKAFAAIGFVGGNVISLAIFAILGLLDSRYRYCDEAGTDMAGASLLGILPNLPDLLSDPEQAAIAAHCVHQIRTLLQISGNSYGRNVFAITSAAAGDGKTSLSLALGLSFAASSSRTLLIDCDLVGAGLTARMNVRSEQGVLEAMASPDIDGFIRDTDVNNLWILPVGEALGSFAGTVSPAAVRRLIEEARKKFDVVLIDTGPVLGSIEASPVAVAADAVVLCVSRGQHKPIVDKAMFHLASIGCKLAGVVFNRAQSQDFERSVSRMALPSIPATANGHGKRREASASGNAFGPVARAVATSVKPPAGSENN